MRHVFTELSKHISHVRQEMLNSMKEKTACQNPCLLTNQEIFGISSGSGYDAPILSLATSFAHVFLVHSAIYEVAVQGRYFRFSLHSAHCHRAMGEW